jgi:MYXO-CTERM domain-containing protein
MPAKPPGSAPGGSGPSVGLANRPAHNLVLGALLLGGIGMVLPWVYTGTSRENGLSIDDGRVYGALLLVAVLLVLLWRRRRIPALSIGVGAIAVILTVVAAYDVVHVSTAVGPSGDSSSLGVGLLVNAAAAVGLCIAVANVLRKGRQPDP